MSGTAISQWIADLGIWPLIVMLLPNLMLFRKHGQAAAKKRIASLYQDNAVFTDMVVLCVVATFELTDTYLFFAAVVVAAGAYLLRKKMFPYRLTCPECDRKHDLFSSEFKNVYVMDDHLCDACRTASRAEESVQEPVDDPE